MRLIAKKRSNPCAAPPDGADTGHAAGAEPQPAPAEQAIMAVHDAVVEAFGLACQLRTRIEQLMKERPSESLIPSADVEQLLTLKRRIMEILDRLYADGDNVLPAIKQALSGWPGKRRPFGEVLDESALATALSFTAELCSRVPDWAPGKQEVEPVLASSLSQMVGGGWPSEAFSASVADWQGALLVEISNELCEAQKMLQEEACRWRVEDDGLWLANKRIEVSPQTKQIFEVLIKAGGRALVNDVCGKLWKERPGSGVIKEVLSSRLRQAIKKANAEIRASIGGNVNAADLTVIERSGRGEDGSLCLMPGYRVLWLMAGAEMAQTGSSHENN